MRNDSCFFTEERERERERVREGDREKTNSFNIYVSFSVEAFCWEEAWLQKGKKKLGLVSVTEKSHKKLPKKLPKAKSLPSLVSGFVESSYACSRLFVRAALRDARSNCFVILCHKINQCDWLLT